MKLLFFIHSMGSGGAERVTANLANYWVRRGWDITIVTLAPQNTDFYELHPAVKRIDLKLAGDSGSTLAGLWQNLRRITALRRVLRQEGPDIALAMMTTANVLLALAIRDMSRICAIGSERTHPPQYPLGRLWEMLRRHTYGRLTAVAALTHESADWLKTYTNSKCIPVIPNPAVWPLPAKTLLLAPESACRPGRSILLAVGRASEEKQFGLLIEVFRSLARQHDNWDLVILGEGPQRAALKDQVWMAGLGTRIFFPGRVGNVGDWYQRADAYVLSSRVEGFPNTLVEAMAYGLPVVSFDCDTGPRDIIRHEVDGLLVASGDAAALAVALDRAMGDDELRRRLAARAVETRERFSIERIACMWEELFKASLR